MSQDKSDFNMDDLLDGTIDDLADFPEFRPYNEGAHLCMYTLERDKKDKNVIYSCLKLIETKEQTDSKATPMEPGAETRVRHDLSNEFGQGQFKRIMTAAAAKFGAKSNRALMEEMNSVEVLVVTKLNENKKSLGKFFTDIVEIEVM